MPRTREWSTSPQEPSGQMSDGGYSGSWRLHVGRNDPPETVGQAMMEAPPFTAMPLSKEELTPLLDAVVEAMSVLNERESWIVYARVWRRMSVRQVAAEMALSKTHVFRLWQAALVKLRGHMELVGVADQALELFGRSDGLVVTSASGHLTSVREPSDGLAPTLEG